MPIYEYDCVACGRRFELLVGSFAEGDAPRECPVCGAGGCRKVFSAFAMRTGGGPKAASSESSGGSSCGSCTRSSCAGCG